MSIPIVRSAVRTMIYSLGHNTLSTDDFVSACVAANIDTIIDTRSHPGSANYPHFNREQMKKWLLESGIDYLWQPSLGGWANRHLGMDFSEFDVDVSFYTNNAFPKQRIAKKRDVDDDQGFTNYGFHDYQFFMSLPEFMDGVDYLLEYSKDKNVACICCEALWTRCHRSMIGDFLVWRGYDMTHVIPRFRKIKKPRVAVSLKQYSEVLVSKTTGLSRLNRYHPYVISKWEERYDLN